MINNDCISKVPVDLLCLTLLKEKDRYGYEIAKEILDRSGGILSITLPAVYISLHRLEKSGFITAYPSRSGGSLSQTRARLYYHLEPLGRENRETLLALYRRALKGTENFLNYLPNKGSG